MLTLYKNSFYNNLNAIYNTKNCYSKIVASALLKMLSHYYIKQERYNKPFYL